MLAPSKRTTRGISPDNTAKSSVLAVIAYTSQAVLALTANVAIAHLTDFPSFREMAMNEAM